MTGGKGEGKVGETRGAVIILNVLNLLNKLETLNVSLNIFLPHGPKNGKKSRGLIGPYEVG